MLGENIIVVEHKNISEKQLNDIALLKDQHWTYGVKSQKEWINNQFNPNDFHVLLYRNDALLAYVGMNRIKCSIDENEYMFMGIGNVCVDKHNKYLGLGSMIINFVNDMIFRKKDIGILLCHKNLCPFYSKFGWKTVEYKNAFIGEEPFKECIMFNNIFESTINTIIIEKNF